MQGGTGASYKTSNMEFLTTWIVCNACNLKKVPNVNILCTSYVIKDELPVTEKINILAILKRSNGKKKNKGPKRIYLFCSLDKYKPFKFPTYKLAYSHNSS